MSGETIYYVLASSLTVVVLGGVAVAMWTGIRDGLRDYRKAKADVETWKQLQQQRQAAGLAGVDATPVAIEPERAGAVSGSDGRPVRPEISTFPFRYGEPRPLPPLTEVERALLRRVGTGATIYSGVDAVRLKRLHEKHPDLLRIFPTQREPRAFLRCQVKLWALGQLLRPQPVTGYQVPTQFIEVDVAPEVGASAA